MVIGLMNIDSQVTGMPDSVSYKINTHHIDDMRISLLDITSLYVLQMNVDQIALKNY